MSHVVCALYGDQRDRHLHTPAFPQRRSCGLGLFERASCPCEKASTSLSMPAARPVVPDSPPHRGPGRAARHPGAHSEIGRAHVCTPVTNAHLVCRLLLEKTKQTITHTNTIQNT